MSNEHSQKKVLVDCNGYLARDSRGLRVWTPACAGVTPKAFAGVTPGPSPG